MGTEPQHCYLDESGGHGFDFSKKGTSSHFVVAGVVVDDAMVTELEKQIEAVAQKHFSGGEIRSKNVGRDDERRIRILSDILQFNFHIYCLVIDKRKLTRKGGLRYKRSFYKFLNRLAYDELYQAFPKIRLFADEIGSKDFMDGFVKYVESRCLTKDMFGYSAFGFQSSTSNRLIQLADFAVGTIARCYEQNTFSSRADDIMGMLVGSKKLLPIREWPKPELRFATPTGELEVSKFDLVIKEQNLRLAQKFLDKSKSSKDATREQVATLEFLLFAVTHGNPARYVSTKEILDHLRVLPEMRVDKKMLGRSVIDKLRDAGVMIASNTRGYKFVANERDLDQFVHYYDNFIGPMLKRLRICRDKILMSTKNKLDIVDSDKYAYLRDFFDTKR